MIPMTNMQSYVSARGRATALTVLVIVQLALMGLATVALAVGGAVLDESRVVGGALVALGSVLTFFDVLVFFAATVVFLTWVHRSIANLWALESLSNRFTPSEAVWGYIVPFLNL